MSEGAKLEFETNEDSLFVNARARLSYLDAWIGYQSPGNQMLITETKDKSIYIIIALAVIGLSFLSGYSYISKKREQ